MEVSNQILSNITVYMKYAKFDEQKDTTVNAEFTVWRKTNRNIS